MKINVVLLGLALLLGACDRDDDNPNGINANDRDFVMKASMGNFAEVDAGILAASKATNEGIRDFGNMMAKEHTDAQNKLKPIAADLQLPAPDSLDAAHVALKAKLSTLTGRAFDSVYIHSQVADHHTTIDLFEKESRSGANKQLREYANNLLPNLNMHLHMADSLAAEYK